MGELLDLDPRRRESAEPEQLWREVLGEQIRRARHEHDRTQTWTAGRAGISPQYLSEIERGVKDPSSEIVAAVAGALDLTVRELTRRAVLAMPYDRGTRLREPSPPLRIGPTRISGPVALAS
ncbi:helix-turn-helix domain-containing protein [Propionibacteriaceae bacterium Y1685]|uniref:helix-turn-helix domain-containing protein n=1 Tax=Microlunatus sp. Y1700 TaxID=3418487 RepID=UPI003B81BF97